MSCNRNQMLYFQKIYELNKYFVFFQLTFQITFDPLYKLRHMMPQVLYNPLSPL